jgi:hypothetical protein
MPHEVNQTQGISTKRLWLLRTVFVVISLILSITVVEVSLWIIAPVPYPEWMQWIPDGHIKGRAEPRQTFHGITNQEVRINSLGFRGPEYDWKPAPGTLRLVVFSGSAGFCYHQREEETWPGRLQFYLGQHLKIPVEVINLSLPGYDASNSKINYLFTGRALHPHVALIYHTWNDLKFFRSLERSPKEVVFAGFAIDDKPLWQRLARKTQIGRRIRNFLYARHQAYNENQYTSLEKEGKGANRPVLPVALQWGRKNFEDFVRFTQGDGVLPVLISQATIVSKGNLDRVEYRRATETDYVGMTMPVLLQTWLGMNQIIREVSEQNSAIFVDGYDAVPHDFKCLEDHVHLTTQGCDILARAIAATLLNDERFLHLVNSLQKK